MANKNKTNSRLIQGIFYVLGCIIFCENSAHAQQSEALFAFEQTRTKVATLLANEHYEAAYNAWADLSDAQLDPLQLSEKAFGSSFCGLKAGHADAVYNMQSFATGYPLSAHADQASFLIAHYYFEKNQFANVREWLSKVSQANLNDQEVAHYRFMQGYSAFKLGKYNAARADLLESRNDLRFAQASLYYLGYIDYTNGQYTEALGWFDQVDIRSGYHQEILFYRADIGFKLGDYPDAIHWAQQAMVQANAKEKNILNKVAGASFFALEQYKEALPYLESHTGLKGRKTPEDLYQLGYCYYQTNAFDKAVMSFNKMVDQNNLLGQNAYYHLAACYLALDKKPSALNAFKKASVLDFSQVIKREAAFNYAQLAYEIGINYSSVPEVLQTFLEDYPDHAQANTIVDLLVASLMQEKNYQSVLDLLKNQDGMDQKLAYQRAAFYRGLQAYNQADLTKAHEMIQTALKGPYGRDIYLRAQYWSGVLEAEMGNLTEAIAAFQGVLRQSYFVQTPEYGQVFYELGYALFQNRDYEGAKRAFTDYLKQEPQPNMKSDAQLRLADCHYVARRYDEALRNYQAVSSGVHGSRDYAWFQSAICLGLLNETETKISYLLQFKSDFPSSLYGDDALYALGTTYLLEDNTQEAKATFNALIGTMPQSLLVPKSWLRLGLISDNAGNSAEAITIFKKITSDFPASSEAIQAVKAAKNSYVALGDVSAYGKWVEGLTFVTLENSELDAASFQAAMQPYTGGDFALAQVRMTQYLSDYPQGLSQIEARFYLAQILWEQDQKLEALTQYNTLLELGINDYTEPTLVRLSEYHLSQKDYTRAQYYLYALLDIVVYPKNKLFAIQAAMNAAYAMAQYEEALLRAEELMELNKIDDGILLEAEIVKARVLIKMGQLSEAELAYTQLATKATQELAAEVLYHQAYFRHLDKAYETSNELIQELAQKYPSYPYYGAKGLVLMALNFEGLADFFQANFILESVLENFEGFPEIIRQAQTEQERLQQIQNQSTMSDPKEGESNQQEPE